MTPPNDLDLTHLRFNVDRIGVATILFDRAGESVNSLGPDVFVELERVVEICETDPAVRAVVIGSAKPGTFIVGADVRWLVGISTEDEALSMLAAGNETLDRIEALHEVAGKPVVAAIDGNCLGGGLEVAMTCSARVVADRPSTRLGQPEVRLGLIPGAGGTQRLPALIGLVDAVDLIASGRSVGAAAARRMGLVDHLAPPEDLISVARSVAVGAIADRRARRRFVALPSYSSARAWRRWALEKNPVGRAIVFRGATRRIEKTTKGHYPAPLAALRAVRAGVERGRAAGFRAEAGEFRRLLVGREAKALISLFLATRDARKRAAPPTVELERLTNVGIVGGGFMGAGIAAVSVIRAGARTVVTELTQAALKKAMSHVRSQIERGVRRGRMAESDADGVADLLRGTTDVDDLKSADVVIEAVFEDLDLKRSVLARVEAVTAPSTIFATNTSSLPISDIAARSQRPANVIGMHYFSPVERMPLLEIVRTEKTDDAVVAACAELGGRQGKTVILVEDGPGFYTTRVLAPYAAEAFHLVEEGVPIESIDAAMTAWGFPVGPVALFDEVGIDIGAKIAGVMEAAFGDRMRAPEGFTALLADERLGRKKGRGFYLYEKGKKAGPDPAVYRLLGVEPVADVEHIVIQQRLILRMINEAALCLQEGILRTAGDGDVGAVLGLGFPAFRGGPFFYTDAVGPAVVVDQMRSLVGEHGSRFKPAPILVEQARAGLRFCS